MAHPPPSAGTFDLPGRTGHRTGQSGLLSSTLIHGREPGGGGWGGVDLTPLAKEP